MIPDKAHSSKMECVKVAQAMARQVQGIYGTDGVRVGYRCSREFRI